MATSKPAKTKAARPPKHIRHHRKPADKAAIDAAAQRAMAEMANEPTGRALPKRVNAICVIERRNGSTTEVRVYPESTRW